MAISVETVVLKVEGQTDGAVRATQKLAQAQSKLKQEVQSVSKAMSDVPATRTAGLLSQVGGALKTAGIDAQTFSAGLKDIGKGLTFDLIRQGLKGLNTEIKGVAGSALSAGVNGAAMGAAFGGPLGAAIGGAAGALVGLIRHTDRQSEASLRAAEAAKKHAAALRLVAEGESKGRQGRRSAREAVELAEAELDQERLAATRAGLGQDAPNVRRAQRALREAQAEREALNRADGAIWLEQRQREIERLDMIRDIEAARQSGIITAKEAQQRLNDLNGVEEKAAEVTEKATKAIENRTKARMRQVQVESDIAQSGLEIGEAKIFSQNFTSPAELERWIAAEEKRKRMLSGVDVPTTARAKSMDAYVNIEEQLKGNKRTQLDREEKRAAAEASKLRLENAFGKLDEINAYKLAFDGLGGSVTSAMQAWIDGSMSAGQAAKKFAGEYLSTVAATLAIEALKEGAYAVASSIPGPFFNPAATAGHAAAAAQYGVAAAAAAGMAKALGGGAAPTPSGAGAGATGADGFGSTARDHRDGSTGPLSPDSGRANTIVIYESTFAEGSARFRRQRAQRVVAEVNGGIGWSND